MSCFVLLLSSLSVPVFVGLFLLCSILAISALSALCSGTSVVLVLLRSLLLYFPLVLVLVFGSVSTYGEAGERVESLFLAGCYLV